MKKCNKCGINKPLDEFYKNKSHLDGRQNNCKKCTIIAAVKYKQDKAGEPGWIYIVSNPAWPDHFKVGMTNISTQKRLKSYQIGSPFRDYKLLFSKFVSNAYKVEKSVAERFNANFEWYNEELTELIAFIKSL